MSIDRQDALAEIAAIARRHGLTAGEIAAAMQQTKTGDEESLLSRIFAYVGGVLVLAGVCIFFGLQWENLTSAARLLLTLGSGIVFMTAGFVLLARNPATRAATPLFLCGLLLETGGLYVLLDEYGAGGEPVHGMLFISGTMLAQQALLLLASRRAVFSFFALLFGASFCGILLELAGIDDNLIAVTLGISLLLIGHTVTARAHANVMPFWLFTGALLLLCGAFDMVYRSPLEFVYIGIAAAVMYISLLLRSRAVLILSTLAMLAFIGYFTDRHFSDTLGWPLVLVLTGGAFIGLGALALRLHAKFIRAS